MNTANRESAMDAQEYRQLHKNLMLVQSGNARRYESAAQVAETLGDKVTATQFRAWALVALGKVATSTRCYLGAL